MSIIKKSLCGLTAAVFLCSMAPSKALNPSHFDRLIQIKEEIMPPFKNKIIFEKLPDVYKYLQELFFLSVYRDQKGDDVKGLDALCSFIELMRMQMKGITPSTAEKSDNVFIELIHSLYYSMKFILIDILHEKIDDFRSLEIALKIYAQIDSNKCQLEKLKDKDLYDYYLSMKSYMCLRYMQYCNRDSDVFKSAIDYCISRKFPIYQINYAPLEVAGIISLSRVYAYYTSIMPVDGFSQTDEFIINNIRESMRELKRQLEAYEEFREPDSKRVRLNE